MVMRWRGNKVNFPDVAGMSAIGCGFSRWMQHTKDCANSGVLHSPAESAVESKRSPNQQEQSFIDLIQMRLVFF
jgi:hypothetical protein